MILTREVAERFIEDYRGESTCREIAEKYGVSRQTLHNWATKARKSGIEIPLKKAGRKSTNSIWESIAANSR